MADNEYVYDGDVQRITAAELMPILPSQGGGFRLMFRVEFKDGRTQLRASDQCSCPEAITEYERQYYKAKWPVDRDDSPSRASSSKVPTTSQSKSEASGSRADADDEATPSKSRLDEGEGSEYADDAHLNDFSSDDSIWPSIVDAQGRPGTDPEARAAIRKEWAAGDETFKKTKTESSSSSDPDDVSDRSHKASIKSEALSDDSLLQELKAKASPPASPDNGPAARAGRRTKAARLLSFEEYVFGRKKVASDPALPDGPSGSGLQMFKKRSAAKDKSPKASASQRYKRIKVEEDDASLPPMPAFPAGPLVNKAVEVIDLSSDDDVITIDSD